MSFGPRISSTALRLTHPHILPLFDSGTADRMLYYVMPVVEGESLQWRASAARPPGWDRDRGGA